LPPFLDILRMHGFEMDTFERKNIIRPEGRGVEYIDVI